MDLSTIKQVIGNTIPSNVNISDINIIEGNGKLTVQISWEVLKASYPDLNSLPKIVTEKHPRLSFMDGFYPFQLPISELELPLSSSYRDKLRADFEKSEAEANKLRLRREREHLDSLLEKAGETVNVVRSEKNLGITKVRFDSEFGGWTTSSLIQNGDVLVGLTGCRYEVLSTSADKDGVCTKFRYKFVQLSKSEITRKNAESIRDAEDERILEEIKLIPLCMKVMAAHPRQVDEYKAGHKGNFGFLLSALLVENNLAFSKVIDVKFISEVLERAIKNTETEEARILKELANKINSTFNDTKEVKSADGKVVEKITFPDRGKLVSVAVRGNDEYVKSLVRAGIDPESARNMAVITNIDLPITKQPTIKEELNAKSQSKFTSEYRKQKHAGNFRRVEQDGIKPRFVKKASEVVAEYKKAIEAYENRFGIGQNRLNPNDKGKRGVSAFTPSTQPFSSPLRNVTDVEVMFMANEKMAKLVEPPSLLADLKAFEAKLPRISKLKKILFHLKSIKDEILRT
jgi:hypothetical protein